MPAMPKEKAVLLTERNINEFNIEELSTTSSSTIKTNITSAFEATSTGAANVPVSTTVTANNIVVVNNRLQQEQQQQQQMKNNTCGCGARSAAIESVVGHNTKLEQQEKLKKITMQQQQNHKNGFSTSSSASLKRACCRTQIYSDDNVGSNNMTPQPKAVKNNNYNYYNKNNINIYYNNNDNSSPKRNIVVGYCPKMSYSNYMSGNSTNTNSSISSNSSSCSKGGDSSNPALDVNLTNANTTSIGRNSVSANAKASANDANSVVIMPKKSPKDFIFGKYIGEGSYSIVYLAVDVHTKKEFAIKVCEKRHILRENKQEYIRREREVMHIMTNVPGFVNLSCTFQDHRSLYFVMTYAKNGDMLPYINRVGSFDLDCSRHYAAELVLACENMHNRDVVHRDLKPENILLDENMHILIADFGSAKIMTPNESDHDNDDDDDGDDYNDDNNEAQNNLKMPNVGIDIETSTSSTSGSDGDNDVNNKPNKLSLNYLQSEEKGQKQQYKKHKIRNPRKRRGSFVGTAQYVSPEVLNDKPITPAVDLWALGCIIYQMISGLPPYRGSTDYLIFKEILGNTLEFPDGFDSDAKDLVKKLLKLNANERLGAQDIGSGTYTSIRQHAFFAGIDFDNIRQYMPPPIHPYLPGVSQDESDSLFTRIPYSVPANLEPGLDDKQITRLLGMELGTVFDNKVLSLTDHEYDDDHERQDDNDTKKTSSTRGASSIHLSNTSSSSTSTNNETSVPVLIAKDANNEQYEKSKNNFDLTLADKQKRLEQQKADVWHVFVDNEVILRKGLVNKRKGLFARKRMLLLTTGPRLIYIDPVQMVKKGEIPWSIELRVEPKNFKIFFVHTPNRTYYLEDPEGYALQWVNAIRKMYALTYKDVLKPQQDDDGNNKEEEHADAYNKRELQQKTQPDNFNSCGNNSGGNINNTILPITMKTSSLIYKNTTGGYPNKSLNSDNSDNSCNCNNINSNFSNSNISSKNNSYNTVINPIKSITTIKTPKTMTKTPLLTTSVATTTTNIIVPNIKSAATTTTASISNNIENLTNSMKSAAIVLTAYSKMPLTTITKTELRKNSSNTQATPKIVLN